jgi:hypothetical protein
MGYCPNRFGTVRTFLAASSLADMRRGRRARSYGLTLLLAGGGPLGRRRFRRVCRCCSVGITDGDCSRNIEEQAGRCRRSMIRAAERLPRMRPIAVIEANRQTCRVIAGLAWLETASANYPSTGPVSARKSRRRIAASAYSQRPSWHRPLMPASSYASKAASIHAARTASARADAESLCAFMRIGITPCRTRGIRGARSSSPPWVQCPGRSSSRATGACGFFKEMCCQPRATSFIESI